MKGRTISIDREKCDGCGICAEACHEDAIDIIDGKAVLNDVRCDGLGDCLPACPENAISFSDSDELPMVSKDHTADFGKRSGKWPIQLKLIQTHDDRFSGADILFATDCTGFVSPIKRFIGERTVLIGCPKFDAGDYSERLAEIFTKNDVRSVLLVRMEVPCCVAMEKILKGALMKAHKKIPYKVVILNTEGVIVN